MQGKGETRPLEKENAQKTAILRRRRRRITVYEISLRLVQRQFIPFIPFVPNDIVYHTLRFRGMMLTAVPIGATPVPLGWKDGAAVPVGAAAPVPDGPALPPPLPLGSGKGAWPDADVYGPLAPLPPLPPLLPPAAAVTVTVVC